MIGESVNRSALSIMANTMAGFGLCKEGVFVSDMQKEDLLINFRVAS